MSTKVKCEWDPKSRRRLRDGEESNCKEAVVIVGTHAQFALCKACAESPIFNPYKVRKLIQKAKGK